MTRDEIILLWNKLTMEIGTNADQIETFYRAAHRAGQAEMRERANSCCEDAEEKPWYGYENPNTFKDGVWACQKLIRALPLEGEQE